eukprot:jgi/Chrzof1/3636/Cz13g03090.t1
MPQPLVAGWHLIQQASGIEEQQQQQHQQHQYQQQQQRQGAVHLNGAAKCVHPYLDDASRSCDVLVDDQMLTDYTKYSISLWS